MTSELLKAVCDAWKQGEWSGKSSPLSLMEFQAIHEAARECRKQAVQEVIDKINLGKLRVYKTAEE